MYKIRAQTVEVLNLQGGTLDYYFRILQDPCEHQFHKHLIDDREVTQEEFKEQCSHFTLVTSK